MDGNEDIGRLCLYQLIDGVVQVVYLPAQVLALCVGGRVLRGGVVVEDQLLVEGAQGGDLFGGQGSAVQTVVLQVVE